MNKENNRTAAGLRRSAVAERIRLKEEWSALKGTDNVPPPPVTTKKKVTNTRQRVTRSTNKNTNMNAHGKNSESAKNNEQIKATNDVLRGVVALVEVGSATRALALRAALSALGASVVPIWTPLITHLIWAEGGCRLTRNRARALACRVVSPLWVEACAAAGARQPDRAFPAPPRPSDLPSPGTLKRLLKKAEMENIPLHGLYDLNEDKQIEQMRLRISSGTEQDTTHSTDTSSDTSQDQSRDKTDKESRVNTVTLPRNTCKSRRKLFTQREDALDKTQDNDKDSDRETTAPAPKRVRSKMTEREKKDLARAERMARKLAASTPIKTTQSATQTIPEFRIVLTGMCRSERRAVYNAIKTLNGHIQKEVNRKTTHVLLGSCKESHDLNISGVTRCPANTSYSPLKIIINSKSSPMTNVTNKNISPLRSVPDKVIPRCGKERTFSALSGAARGCRVLYAQWAVDSMLAKKWLHHQGYEVTHLRKISQKARVERTALGKTRAEYGYDVFNGMRVRMSPSAEQKDVAVQLLKLCGAVAQDGAGSGANIQNNIRHGATMATDYDLLIGVGEGEINSKWVFDSVASARMRTTRRYINKRDSNDVNNMGESSDVVFVSQNRNR